MSVARRRRKSAGRPLLAVIAVVVVAAIGWTFRHDIQAWHAAQRGPASQPVATNAASTSAVDVSAAHADPANDGKRVRVSGSLEANAPARDAELGISAKGALLLRRVEMYQWHENCSGDDCRYAADWSEKSIDSHRFRHPDGHENPPAKLANAHFAAAGLRLGAYSVGADLVAAQGEGAATDVAARAAELPPNLAASFGDAGGALYAGGDPAHPRVGEMRISYRVVPLGPVVLTGIQRGTTLAPE